MTGPVRIIEALREETLSGAVDPPAAQSSFHLTDMGNAERLAAEHGDRLKFVPSWGWLAWNGRRWERDSVRVSQLAKATVRHVYAEAEHGADKQARSAIARHATKSESDARITALLHLAQSEPAIVAKPEWFDACPMLLNVANGTLDLETGKLRPHDSADYLTHTSAALFQPDARCPTWNEFLGRVFAGNADLIEFVQRAVGYSLTAHVTEQCLFFCFGRGQNGKSTFIEVLSALLGDYAHKTPTETLMEKRYAGGVPNDVAALVGKRLVVAAELPEGRRLNEPLIKDLTGGDMIPARFLHQEFFQFHPQFKLWIYGNHRPVIRGTDEGIWRRMRLIPFSVTVPENERDPNMTGRLLAELPGILTWAVEGSLAWQRRGLGMPAEIRDATAAYRADQDLIAAFLAECCSQDGEVVASALLEAYRNFSGDTKMSSVRLAARLRERGLDSRHTHRGAMWPLRLLGSPEG